MKKPSLNEDLKIHRKVSNMASNDEIREVTKPTQMSLSKNHQMMHMKMQDLIASKVNSSPVVHSQTKYNQVGFSKRKRSSRIPTERDSPGMEVTKTSLTRTINNFN